MRVAIKYKIVDFLDSVLTEELSPHSGLSDANELALIRSIRDKMRREGSEPT